MQGGVSNHSSFSTDLKLDPERPKTKVYSILAEEINNPDDAKQW